MESESTMMRTLLSTTLLLVSFSFYSYAVLQKEDIDNTLIRLIRELRELKEKELYERTERDLKALLAVLSKKSSSSNLDERGVPRRRFPIMSRAGKRDEDNETNTADSKVIPTSRPAGNMTKRVEKRPNIMGRAGKRERIYSKDIERESETNRPILGRAGKREEGREGSQPILTRAGKRENADLKNIETTDNKREPPLEYESKREKGVVTEHGNRGILKRGGKREYNGIETQLNANVEGLSKASKNGAVPKAGSKVTAKINDTQNDDKESYNARRRKLNSFNRVGDEVERLLRELLET